MGCSTYKHDAACGFRPPVFSPSERHRRVRDSECSRSRFEDRPANYSESACWSCHIVRMSVEHNHQAREIKLANAVHACRAYDCPRGTAADRWREVIDYLKKDGAKGIAVLPLFPIFRQFFHFHENPSSSVISGTFSPENRFPQKRPKIAKHTKHEPLPKRDAIFATFP